jgi:galactokinase
MVKHSLADTEYNVRRQQCEHGVAVMKNFLPGSIHSLRDVPLSALQAHKADMDQTVFNRCLYVVTEIERLLQGCKLLAQHDLAGFGELMYETHKGLSTLYDVSCIELDFLAEQAHGFDGVSGTRMMGGGFGGCTINLVKQEKVGDFTSFIKEKYLHRFRKETEVYITQIEDGTKMIP